MEQEIDGVVRGNMLMSIQSVQKYKCKTVTFSLGTLTTEPLGQILKAWKNSKIYDKHFILQDRSMEEKQDL